MKKIVFVFYVSLCIPAMILFVSCAGTGTKIPVWEFPYFNLTSESVQSRGGLTVEVEVLKPSDFYKHPKVFSYELDQIPQNLRSDVKFWYEEDLQGKRWLYTFGCGDHYLTAMIVKITNKTSHILRMKDARIYLRIEGEDPIRAVTALGDADPVIVDEKGNTIPKSSYEGDESLIHWVTYFEKEYELNRKKGIISIRYPIGLAAAVINANSKKYKLINDVDTEILPGDSYSGILLFPALVEFESANLKLYDMTTKTDAAGNPIEKVTFDFDLQMDTGKMWYDRIQKKWIPGEPPVQTS